MKIFKRSYFTMIEVLVAMGLAMGVLAALMGFYAYVTHIGKLGKELEQKTFEKLYLQSRLTELIPQAVPYFKTEKSKNEEKEIKTDYNFFTTYLNGSSSLTFLFNNKVSNNSLFSGKSLGRIYVNEKKQLSFALFPAPMRWNSGEDIPVKIEVLAEGVDRLDLSFFTPFEGNREEMWKDMHVNKNADKDPNEAPEFPPGQWVSKWKNEYRKLPPIVRLGVIRGKETTKFIIPLPLSEYMILYE